MAAQEETATSTVSAGSGPDSVQVEPRIWGGAPIRERSDPGGGDFSNSGLDLHLHNDPDADADAVTVASVTTEPNGLHRGADPDTGDSTLWGEPSPRRFDVVGTGSSDLSLVGPIALSGVESSMGVSDNATFTMTARELPVVITGVINCFGFLQVITTEESTMVVELTATTTPDAGIGTPVVVSSEVEVFYGRGGSTSIVLPAVTFSENEDSTYDLEASVILRYRDDVAGTFDVAITELQVVLQCIEYSSI